MKYNIYTHFYNTKSKKPKGIFKIRRRVRLKWIRRIRRTWEMRNRKRSYKLKDDDGKYKYMYVHI